MIRCCDADVVSGDRSACVGDSCAGRDVEEGAARGFAITLGVELVPAGVGCSECGRKRGLGGGWRLAAVLAPEGVCCNGCAGVELDGGPVESAMDTSDGGATIRGGGSALPCGDGRTGV